MAWWVDLTLWGVEIDPPGHAWWGTSSNVSKWHICHKSDIPLRRGPRWSWLRARVCPWWRYNAQNGQKGPKTPFLPISCHLDLRDYLGIVAHLNTMVASYVCLAMCVCVRAASDLSSLTQQGDLSEWDLRAAHVPPRVRGITSQKGVKWPHLGVVSDPLFSCFFHVFKTRQRAQIDSRIELRRWPQLAKSVKSAKTAPEGRFSCSLYCPE